MFRGDITDILKHNLINLIEAKKIIVILRGIPSDKLTRCAEALCAGGIKLVELAFDASGKVPETEIAASISELSAQFAGRLVVGAGSVITPAQVRLARSAGAEFIVSPNTDESVISQTLECGMVSIPGALTPTEIRLAHSYGADFVKVFPAGCFGPEYIKAVSTPLSDIKLLAVAGILPDEAEEYLSAGASGLGISSGIVKKEFIDDGDFEAITELAQLYSDIVK